MRIYGLDRAPNAEEGFTGLVHPDDRTRVEAKTSAFLDAGDAYAHEFRIVRPDGEVRLIHDRGAIERAANGTALVLRGINVDVTGGRARQAPDGVRAAHLAAAMGVYDLDLGTGWSAWSPELRRIIDPDGSRSGLPFADIASTIHPDDRAGTAARMEEILRRPGRFELEYRLVPPDGGFRWVVDRGESFGPVNPATGRVARVVGVIIDATERLEAARRARLAMGEVSHRSKNLMSLVQAVARQTARRGSPEDFVERFGARLAALAAAHDLLVDGDWEGVDLHQLVRSQLAHFEDLIGVRILLRGPALRVSANAAQTLGIALHELATNAGKYGALSDERGRVRLSWNLRRDGPEGPGFWMAWVERGGPPASPPARTGFGAQVVEKMVRAGLNAEVRLTYAPEGVTWRLRCPGGLLVEG